MFVDVNGSRCYYEVGGKGDAVVLLHGWGGEVASFRPVFRYLIKNFKVYSFDFPGFGKSNIPTTPWGVSEYSDFLSGFFQRLNIEKASLIAHSFGGRVAIFFATKFLEKVNRLILIDSAGIKPRRTIKYYVRICGAKIGRRIFTSRIFGNYGERVLGKLYNQLGSKDYQKAGSMRGTLVKVVNEDLRPLLPKIQSPTLLIWGENDKDVPLFYGRIMEKEIKGSTLVVLKGAGHFSYLERFSDFCLVVSRFLIES